MMQDEIVIVLKLCILYCFASTYAASEDIAPGLVEGWTGTQTTTSNVIGDGQPVNFTTTSSYGVWDVRYNPISDLIYFSENKGCRIRYAKYYKGVVRTLIGDPAGQQCKFDESQGTVSAPRGMALVDESQLVVLVPAQMLMFDMLTFSWSIFAGNGTSGNVTHVEGLVARYGSSLNHVTHYWKILYFTDSTNGIVHRLSATSLFSTPMTKRANPFGLTVFRNTMYLTSLGVSNVSMVSTIHGAYMNIPSFLATLMNAMLTLPSVLHMECSRKTLFAVDGQSVVQFDFSSALGSRIFGKTQNQCLNTSVSLFSELASSSSPQQGNTLCVGNISSARVANDVLLVALQADMIASEKLNASEKNVACFTTVTETVPVESEEGEEETIINWGMIFPFACVCTAFAMYVAYKKKVNVKKDEFDRQLLLTESGGGNTETNTETNTGEALVEMTMLSQPESTTKSHTNLPV